MIEIKDLLSVFKNLLLGEEIKKRAVIDAIFSVTNINIKEEEIKIKNGLVFLNIKPIYRNEIFLKKDKIFQEIEKVLGQKSPKEFR